MIQTRRAYEPPGPDDGNRFLIDRLWPRGIRKESLKLDGWLKDVSPSNELRKMFGHNPATWDEFRRRYFAELDSNPQAWEGLLETVRKGKVTLVYSARNEDLNNAVALKEYLEARLKAQPTP